MTEPKTTHLAAKALAEPRDQATHHAALFERVIGRIYRYFNRRIWNANDAEDLTQQTLLVLEQSLRNQTYDPAKSFNTWMWIKAHTVFAQYCRERERAPEQLASDAVGSIEAPDASEQNAVRLDTKTLLQNLERTLGSETYTCFLLYTQGDLNHAEIAEVVDRNRKTVATRIADAMAFFEKANKGV